MAYSSPRCPPARALWLGLAACLPLLSRAALPAPHREIDFNFDVRPILADRCFKCHGPDEKARKAKLRLDRAETAYAVRDEATGKRAIVPGHPDQSELCRRISAGEHERMPPPASNLGLSEDEKETLRQWIKQGAPYKPHWAFIPVGEAPVPKPADASRVRNPVDAFVVTRLEREGLKLAPEAGRETLIRRLSLDLRGLPAALREVDDFVQDNSPDAYEKLVDKFLASPRYGEHEAGRWLDLARFADTYGYQADVDVDLSPWRDWVISAFNANLPYNEFLLWQLAGDLLPSPTRDQVLATAFNRLHRQTNEGGSVEEEFRTEYVADRVATAGTAFLGLTLGCARCHDHKYDPVTQRDFYRMSAFFNNIDESGLYSHFTRATPAPTLLLYTGDREQRHRELLERIQNGEKKLGAALQAAGPALETWTKSGAKIPRPQPVNAYSFESVANNSSPDGLSTNHPALLVDGPIQAEGKTGKALQFSGDNYATCRGAGAFNRTMPFSLGLWLKVAEKQERAVVLHRSRAWTDSGSRGYELLLENEIPSFALIHFWPGNALKVRARTALPLNQWSHLTITYDGSSRAAGLRLYLNGAGLDLEVMRDHLFKDIVHREQWGDADVNAIDLTLAGRFRDSGFKNGLIDALEVFDRCLTPGEVKLLPSSRRGDESEPATPQFTPDDLSSYYVQNLDPACRAALDELAAARQKESAFINDIPEIMVMSEMSPRRPTFLLKRGAYDAPGEALDPGTPEQIFPFPDSLPPNRLGLARWMLDPRNPLTARVVVNRAWAVHFGRGLVVTEEDFGVQGRLPSNPALLDWLAWRLVQSGWDLKALHKQIVVSATYRQSSRASPELLARDPDNDLLARGPKHRLRAEEIRDSALAISGLLSERIGGPSVKPYQPDGLWEQSGTGKQYKQNHGEALYRRSLYTFWRRTAPPPTMLIFDAPTREVCTARRETTATPLQALVLLNDPQFLEAARVLAEHLIRDYGSDSIALVGTAFRLATGRKPDPAELKMLTRLYDEQVSRFAANASAAETYLTVGESKLDSAIPRDRLAATAVLASACMNLDEFVIKR